jgi:hypothetical protein
VVGAQNLLFNGDFVTNLSGWMLTESPQASAQWVDDDADGLVQSGSAEIRETGNGAQIVLFQCMPLAGLSDPIAVGAAARVLLEGEAEVSGLLLIRQFSEADCTFAPGYPPDWHTVNQSQSAWLAFDGSFTRSAPEIQSVMVMLAIYKPDTAGTGGAVRFDNVYFGGTGAGPELLTLRRWSIDTGGGRASGGGLSLTGSIGQPEAGSASGGDVSLQSGFWFGAGSTPPPSGDAIFRNGFE